MPDTTARRRRAWPVVAVAALVTLAAATAARAEMVTYGFTGVISASNTDNNPLGLPTLFPGGTPFTGSMTFDPADSQSPIALEMTAGGQTLLVRTSHWAFDLIPGFFQIISQPYGDHVSPGGYSVDVAGILLNTRGDPTGISGTPADMVVDFGKVTDNWFAFSGKSQSPGLDDWTAVGQLTSLRLAAAAPEPGSLALAGAGAALALLCRWRRSNRGKPVPVA